jgi:hypothetical protein
MFVAFPELFSYMPHKKGRVSFSFRALPRQLGTRPLSIEQSSILPCHLYRVIPPLQRTGKGRADQIFICLTRSQRRRWRIPRKTPSPLAPG